MGQFSAANCLCFQHILHRPPEWLLKCRSDHVTVLPKDIKRPPATWIQLKLLTWFWGCSVWGSPFSQWGQQGHQVQPGRLRTTPGGNDTQRRSSGAPPRGEQWGSPPSGCIPHKPYLGTHHIFFTISQSPVLFHSPQGCTHARPSVPNAPPLPRAWGASYSFTQQLTVNSSAKPALSLQAVSSPAPSGPHGPPCPFNSPQGDSHSKEGPRSSMSGSHPAQKVCVE